MVYVLIKVIIQIYVKKSNECQTCNLTLTHPLTCMDGLVCKTAKGEEGTSGICLHPNSHPGKCGKPSPSASNQPKHHHHHHHPSRSPSTSPSSNPSTSPSTSPNTSPVPNPSGSGKNHLANVCEKCNLEIDPPLRCKNGLKCMSDNNNFGSGGICHDPNKNNECGGNDHDEKCDQNKCLFGDSSDPCINQTDCVCYPYIDECQSGTSNKLHCCPMNSVERKTLENFQNPEIKAYDLIDETNNISDYLCFIIPLLLIFIFIIFHKCRA